MSPSDANPSFDPIPQNYWLNIFSSELCGTNTFNISNPFQILDAVTGRPILDLDGTATTVDPPGQQPALFSFVDVPGISRHAYDIVSRSNETETYLAITTDGRVIFHPKISPLVRPDNGAEAQDLSSPSILTTAWSMTCDGQIIALPLEGSARSLAISDGVLRFMDYDSTSNGVKAPESYNATRLLRDPVNPAYEPVFSHETPNKRDDYSTRQRRRCPVHGQIAVERPNAPTPPTHAYGPRYFCRWPDFSFAACCDEHDLCMDDCSKEFWQCNDRLEGCLSKVCKATYADGLMGRATCYSIEQMFERAIWSKKARKPFDEASQERCRCVYEADYPPKHPLHKGPKEPESDVDNSNFGHPLHDDLDVPHV